MEDHFIYGTIEYGMVDYATVFDPETFLKLEDFDKMWQLIQLKLYKEWNISKEK